MVHIEKEIAWYAQNATRKDDDFIRAQLKLIRELYAEVEDSQDRLFLEKIVATFCEIMQVQRDVIAGLSSELAQTALCAPAVDCFMVTAPAEIADDRQLQEAFIYYMTYQAKKKLSSYTVNDYCSRLKNLWNTYYKAYESGELEQQLCPNPERLMPNSPLVNLSRHLDEINGFVGKMSATSTEKRNWANAAAALNKFVDFSCGNN